ncbi:solute carrier family 49 member A3 isoform X2 [Carcharodon carcharias]|uniref:solute carrier family 49 member A3 isoform X2 n=1 Tax=Carcharodon carcharias TaxID=13397 RepID=UPI001B7F6131|nr:solute carrier family 49 member A3 isoform X2 [Carcharodon carcharias]
MEPVGAGSSEPSSGLRYRSYRRRWFILFVSSTLSCSNAMCWLTFAPVADQTAQYFHISMDQVNWLSMIYLVVGVPFGFGTTWILDMLGLKTSMVVYAVPAVIACLLTTVGIRNKVPPTPPSVGAANSTSEPFFTGMKMLLKNKAYLILMICFGGGVGVFTSFSALLQQIVCVRGYSNTFAGLCGALFIVFGILGAFVFGLYVDKTKKFMETTKINFCLTAFASIAFALVSRMRDQPYGLAVVCSLFGLLGFSIYPVGMELGVECSYPVGEATSAGLIFVSGQLQGALFILLLPALARPVTSDGSACQVGVGAALDWTVPTLVLAAICSLEACCFALLFHTEYRRVSAEDNEDASALLHGTATE